MQNPNINGLIMFIINPSTVIAPEKLNRTKANNKVKLIIKSIFFIFSLFNSNI